MDKEADMKLSTGIRGLDEVLYGGLIKGAAYLLRGGPGTGKTTIGLQFLKAGVDKGEKVLYITLEETESNLRRNAHINAMDLSGIEFLDLSPGKDYFAKIESYDIFSPAEVERAPVTNQIVEKIRTLDPDRVFVDPVTQLCYLSTDVFQFRKQVLSFLRYLTDQKITVLFTSEMSSTIPDHDLQFMADGIIELEFKDLNRFLTVLKYRGSDFIGKRHSMILNKNGASIFPRLIPANYGIQFPNELISSGLPVFDKMLGGGIERGTISYISGPSGVGKTSLGMHFMKEAAARNELSVLFSLEEDSHILVHRCEKIGISVKDMINSGRLKIKKIEPLQFSPDEFSLMVREEVEVNGAKVVMIDSVSGYKLCMRGEDLQAHLHALAKYLQNMGVAVLLSVETSQLTGDFKVTDFNISYLADNIIFLRYIELDGKLRKAIGILKKRMSNFEKQLHDFRITDRGIIVGETLDALRNIITGTPEYIEEEE